MKHWNASHRREEETPWELAVLPMHYTVVLAMERRKLTVIACIGDTSPCLLCRQGLDIMGVRYGRLVGYVSRDLMKFLIVKDILSRPRQ
jgi:hypothetical protein